jgi:hypothetical protein
VVLNYYNIYDSVEKKEENRKLGIQILTFVIVSDSSVLLVS